MKPKKTKIQPTTETPTTTTATPDAAEYTHRGQRLAAGHVDPPTPPPTTAPTPRPPLKSQVDYERREANRSLDTAAVLFLLKNTLPAVHRFAEVIGAWIWVTFDDIPPQDTRSKLSQLGFHWNNTRQVWQHPCGKFSLSTKGNPRDTYSACPADQFTATTANPF